MRVPMPRRKQERIARAAADPVVAAAPPSGRRARVDDAAALALFLALAAALNFSHSRVTDIDSLYHYRHAWVYATRGLWEADFPWPQFSLIRTLAADLWYGLHVLMIPLTWLPDPVAAVKLGSFATTAIALGLFYAAQRRLGAAWPLLGTLVFLFATADLLYRIMMLRPHPLSLGLTLLVFAEATAEPRADDKARRVRLLVYGALIAWMHLAVAWLPLLVVGVVAVVRRVKRLSLDVYGIGAAVLGLAAGTLLRPHPFAALRLAVIQVAYLSLQHQREVPLRFGRELTPFHYTELYKQLLGLLLLLAVALAGLFVLRARRVAVDVATWSSLVVWPVFFLLSFTMFRRANEVMVAFAVTFAGLVAAQFRRAAGGEKWLRAALSSARGTAAATAVAIALVLMPVKTLARLSLFLPNAFDPERFHAVGEWLRQNSAEGEIVFNADWDRFGQLVFWNPHNYYIHGMDPIFLYAYDPGLYWKSAFLSLDRVTSFTCAQVKCSEAVGEDTHTVLKRDFHASYILVERGRNPALLSWLLKAPGFTLAFETADEVLFRIT